MDPAQLLDFLGFSTGEVERMMLILTRLSGFFLAAPFFSRAVGPPTIKAALILVLTIVLYPLTPPWSQEGHSTAHGMMMAGMGEFLVGAMLGMIIHWALVAVQVAGGIMGFEMGLSMAQVMDPTSGLQEGVISNILYLTALMLFLTMDGHHLLVEGMARSFTSLPPGAGLPAAGPLLEATAAGLGRLFLVGVMLAAPVMVAAKLLYLGLGLINRATPQIQVFFIAMPLVQMLGLFVVGVTMAVFGRVVMREVEAFLSLALNVVRLPGG